MLLALETLPLPLLWPFEITFERSVDRGKGPAVRSVLVALGLVEMDDLAKATVAPYRAASRAAEVALLCVDG